MDLKLIGYRLFAKENYKDPWEPTEFYCNSGDCFDNEAEKLKEEAALVYPLAMGLRWVEYLEEMDA
jgi:hypothetical protein